MQAKKASDEGQMMQVQTMQPTCACSCIKAVIDVRAFLRAALAKALARHDELRANAAAVRAAIEEWTLAWISPDDAADAAARATVERVRSQAIETLDAAFARASANADAHAVKVEQCLERSDLTLDALRADARALLDAIVREQEGSGCSESTTTEKDKKGVRATQALFVAVRDAGVYDRLHLRHEKELTEDPLSLLLLQDQGAETPVSDELLSAFSKDPVWMTKALDFLKHTLHCRAPEKATLAALQSHFRNSAAVVSFVGRLAHFATPTTDSGAPLSLPLKSQALSVSDVLVLVAAASMYPKSVEHRGVGFLAQFVPRLELEACSAQQQRVRHVLFKQFLVLASTQKLHERE
jgi:hypothetical protein